MDQLKLLMDYTKFHIGMYVSLCTGLVVILSMEGVKKEVPDFQPYLFGTLACFAIAAAFGGLVGSSLPAFVDYEDFKNAKLGPFKAKLINAEWCAHLEHFFFWVGVIVSIAGLWRISEVSSF